MKVLLIYKLNNKPVFIDNAIAVRIERNAHGIDSWVIETEEGNQLFTCNNWFVYLHYDEKK